MRFTAAYAPILLGLLAVTSSTWAKPTRVNNWDLPPPPTDVPMRRVPKYKSHIANEHPNVPNARVDQGQNEKGF
ncbi:hypothetical protein BDP27DRAFT_1337024 [Rhodocollybia butyracea]|uniref:Uncharacterized protein n=1 Tax=Rhodocollybia butyracea TaxID=206335 RepID=A0A9P5U1A7_9AGAR|nr:hypothetical protein BDP27DRAFT_1337024 [Rhodocollybia butyracea]